MRSASRRAARIKTREGCALGDQTQAVKDVSSRRCEKILARSFLVCSAMESPPPPPNGTGGDGGGPSRRGGKASAEQGEGSGQGQDGQQNNTVEVHACSF